ncbi:hypothetical protein JHW43_007590 [Diplocarpon mali]|nr:hypothetical protein JHW43_007590 [Diplocarpon mali]
MASNNRASIYTQVSTSTDHDRPKSAEKNLWSSMLDSVASGKRLPEKNILVLGGTTESQKEFLEALSTDDSKRTQDRQSSKQPPIANNFALGYTYYDVLDADHEVLVSLDEDCKEKMEEVMYSWRDRGRGGNSLEGGGVTNSTEADVSLPLGPGEWETGLGLPLCVVCQNSDRIEALEKERSWKEEEFDLVLQFLRTVLLKHGASLIYTTPSAMSPLQSLVHSSLGIHSLLKRQPLKHNIIDRDKVLVPPNWDSWGKIRVLRDGFDVEAINQGWSLDIEDSYEQDGPGEDGVNGKAAGDRGVPPVSGGAVESYQEMIRDPSLDALQATASEGNGLKLEVSSQDTQTFLATQVDTLQKIGQVAEPSSIDSGHVLRGRRSSKTRADDADEDKYDEARVNEHIGPVQFNMGGIQVDADDMLQRLKDRQTYQTPEPETPGGLASPDGKNQNEALASFFAGLMKRGGGSTASSPKPGTS